MESYWPGKTKDTFITGLVVGLSTWQIKTVVPCQFECLAKYNQILRVEEVLGSKANSFRNSLDKEAKASKHPGPL